MNDELDIQKDIERMKTNANKIVNITDNMALARKLLIQMGDIDAKGDVPIWMINLNQTHTWAFHLDSSQRIETPEMLAIRKKMAELMREWLTLAIGSSYELIQKVKDEI